MINAAQLGISLISRPSNIKRDACNKHIIVVKRPICDTTEFSHYLSFSRHWSVSLDFCSGQRLLCLHNSKQEWQSLL